MKFLLIAANIPFLGLTGWGIRFLGISLIPIINFMEYRL